MKIIHFFILLLFFSINAFALESCPVLNWSGTVKTIGAPKGWFSGQVDPITEWQALIPEKWTVRYPNYYQNGKIIFLLPGLYLSQGKTNAVPPTILKDAEQTHDEVKLLKDGTISCHHSVRWNYDAYAPNWSVQFPEVISTQKTSAGKLTPMSGAEVFGWRECFGDDMDCLYYCEAGGQHPCNWEWNQ